MRRLLTQSQVAQDEDGNFEFRSIGGLSDDEDDDDDPKDIEARAQRKLHERAVSPSGGASTSIADQAPAVSKSQSSLGGSGAPKPPPPRSRESLDGEAIFAVGENDDWSDGEESDKDEHGRLTRKI